MLAMIVFTLCALESRAIVNHSGSTGDSRLYRSVGPGLGVESQDSQDNKNYWEYPSAKDNLLVPTAEVSPKVVSPVFEPGDKPDTTSEEEDKEGSYEESVDDVEAGVKGFRSEHELPRDVPTKPDYTLRENWAKGSIPGRDVDLGFVPVQTYAQVRKYDTTLHLPSYQARVDASDEDELINAPRLKEVLTHKKLHEVTSFEFLI
jgi:hypothetical protein